jgi:anti-sigma-K factor RskA
VDTPMNHSEYEQLAAGYVLGALEPDDEHVFQRHLGGCAECEANVRDLEEVVGTLAYAAPPVDPPEALWASIQREIRPEGRRAQPQPQAQPQARPVVVRPRRWASPLVARLAAAAAIVAVAALLVWNLNLRDENAGYRDRVTALEQATRLLNEPDTAKVTLEGSAAGAQVTVLAAAAQDRGVLIVENLPPLQRDKVYELWGIPERGTGRPRKAVVFIPLRRQGPQTLEFQMPIERDTVFAITEEPGPDGSEQPTTRPILTGVAQTV